MLKDNFGNRMKTYYEESSKTRLVRRMPVIIRLDGCHFHTYTRGFKKPFDDHLVNVMQKTMKYLCENIQGVVFGYTQSDEISLILVDYAKLTTSAWFDYEVQKMTSVSASMATFAFNKFMLEEYKVVEFARGQNSLLLTNARQENNLKLVEDLAVKKNELDAELDLLDRALTKGAIFDSRAFNIPKEEVANCILWRQLDAEKNSVSSLAQAYFSQKKLNGKNRDEQKKLLSDIGVLWETLPLDLQRGSSCIRVIDSNSGRSQWTIDKNIPKFVNEDRNYIERFTEIGD